MYFLEAKHLFPSTFTLFESNIDLISLFWKGGLMGRQEQTLSLHFTPWQSPTLQIVLHITLGLSPGIEECWQLDANHVVFVVTASALMGRQQFMARFGLPLTIL